MRKEFNFGKWHFNTQKELDTTIKIMLSECPRNIEFENEFFKECINNLHEGVRKANLKVIKFKILDYDGQINEWAFCRERFRGGIYVIGFFEPIMKWHGVTLYPHKKYNVKQNLVNALRQKWSETALKRNEFTKCEKCGADFPELHHKNITFKEIAEKCLCLFTNEELEFGLGDDWWLHENETDALDKNHPSVIKMFELHNGVEYQWLCYNCHKEVKI
jgi:hypothetical protein